MIHKSAVESAGHWFGVARMYMRAEGRQPGWPNRVAAGVGTSARVSVFGMVYSKGRRIIVVIRRDG